MKIPAAGAALFLILLISCSDPYYETEKQYLEQNNETVDLQSDKEIGLLDSYAASDVFFIGEVHGVSENQKLTLKILKNLHDRTGLKNYIAEVGYSSAWMVSRFIETGDEQMLHSVLEGSTGTYFGTEDTEWFLRALRDYNQTLPEDDRIVYTGLDLDHQPRTALIHLDDIDGRAGAAAPELLQSLLEKIPDYLAAGFTREALYEDHLKGIWADFGVNQSPYSSWCGPESVGELELTLRNLHNGLYWYVVENCSAVRDGYVRDNFESIYTDGEKYLGLWGNVHTPAKAVDGQNEFIASILSSENYNVSSFLLLYHNSHGYYPRQPKISVSIDYNPLVSARFRAVNQSPAVFFDLIAPGSPFLISDNMNFSGNSRNAAADYYQACILLSGAEASLVYQQ